MNRFNRRQRNRWGLWAERLALIMLWSRGYRLLAHRLKTPVGEIDLLMHHRKTLIVIEVKARPTLQAGLESLTPRTQERLRRALGFFLTHHPQYALHDMRFDLLVVRPWRIPVHFQQVLL